MYIHDSAIAPQYGAVSTHGRGVAWALVGVLGFSLTVPSTRVASEAGLAPLFIGSARAVLAASLAVVLLIATRQRLPQGSQWVALFVVGVGIVVGFPLLTSYGLQTATASRGAVVVALLPAATAMTTVLMTKERVERRFWVWTTIGAVSVIGFSVVQGGKLQTIRGSDMLLVGAVVAAAVGYARGAILSRELGAWQTVSWALVITSPVMLLLAATSVVVDGAPETTASGWLAFGYLGIVSMFVAFFAWYRGLAIGPVLSVSQTQLIQPVLSIGWAALLLDETVGIATTLAGLAVVASAGMAVRVRSRGTPTNTSAQP